MNVHKPSQHRTNQVQHAQHQAGAKDLKVPGQNASKCDPESEQNRHAKNARQTSHNEAQLQHGIAAAGSDGSIGLDGVVGPLAREEDPPPLGLIPDPLGAPLERCSGQWVHARKADDFRRES